MTAVGIIAFILVLLLSVMIHEWGHFTAAKRFGMKVTEFFVGFGTTLWSTRRGETEYGIKALPAGGYVKIVGMTELDEVEPGDEPRAFYRQPARRRAIVLAAGSAMHFVIAAVLFVAVPMIFGTAAISTSVAAVSECVPTSEQQTCPADSAPSPALAAGLQADDRVVAVDGQPVEEWADLTAALRATGPGPAELTVERDGTRVDLTADLTSITRDGETVPFLGVQPALVTERVGPVDAVTGAGTAFWNVIKGTFAALAAIPAAIPDLLDATFGDGERSAEGLVGPVGIGRISGQVLGAEQVPLSPRIGEFLLAMGALNVFVGIFNLLPLLPLDGGHLAVLGYEEGRKRVYRWRGRPDPGRVDITKLLPIAYGFLALLIGLSVVLLAADILNPVTL